MKSHSKKKAEGQGDLRLLQRNYVVFRRFDGFRSDKEVEKQICRLIQVYHSRYSTVNYFGRFPPYVADHNTPRPPRAGSCVHLWCSTGVVKQVAPMHVLPS